MTFDEYQAAARTTAIYPKAKAIIYPMLGLCGEAGEVAEHIKKMIRDDECVMKPERRDALVKELGDVLWYLANLAEDCGISLESVAITNVMKLRKRAQEGKLKGSGSDR